MHLAQFDKNIWKHVAFGLTILGAGCAGMVAWVLSNQHWGATTAGSIFGGLVLGLLGLLIGSVNVKLNDLRSDLGGTHVALREMINIRPVLDDLTLDYGNWALDPFLGKTLVQLIHRHRPDHILECGSGSSTVLMAHLLNKIKDGGSVTALEHLEEYARKSRRLVKDHDLKNTAEVVFAPLEECEVEGKNLTWYEFDPKRFRNKKIDMVLVDGPPTQTGPLARYPAAFVLEPYLADDCVIVLDDADRKDEKKAARRWAELLEAELEYAGGPKGTYILRRDPMRC